MTEAQTTFRKTIEETRTARNGVTRWHVLPSRRVDGSFDVSFEKGANVSRYLGAHVATREEAIKIAVEAAFAF